jgi:hypothetical protein
MTQPRGLIFAVLLSGLFSGFLGCNSERAIAEDLPPGIVIAQEGLDARHDELTTRVKSAATKVMTQPGLVGVLGGANVKLLKSGTHEILLPLPQLADGQVPICYYIRSTPQVAVTEYRLKEREHANVIVSVRLKGDLNQEVQLDWTAVVLVAGKMVSPNGANPDSYRRSTACAQSESAVIKKLAAELWPANKQLTDYAANIQRFIREMKRQKQPRSLDALGILDSGANGICTANANLALALLREKGIASRSMAVIPSISQQLEMHRIVEYAEDKRWLAFDPSSLHADVPMQPWQSVIMAKTTIADENLAGTPRMGSSMGCPYGQEIELASPGITPWGPAFFWTLAKPLTEFQPDDDVITLATQSWKQYLQHGKLSAGQIASHSATSSNELLEILK